MKFPLLNIDGSKADTIEISDKLVKLKVNHKLIKFVINQVQLCTLSSLNFLILIL